MSYSPPPCLLPHTHYVYTYIHIHVHVCSVLVPVLSLVCFDLHMVFVTVHLHVHCTYTCMCMYMYIPTCTYYCIYCTYNLTYCANIYMYMYMNNIRDNKQSNTIQHNSMTPKPTLFFQRKSCVGLEPTTLCSLDECSTI